MERGRENEVLCWSITAILLVFLCFTHLGVMLCFVAGNRVPAWLTPLALVASLAAGDWLARREGLRGMKRLAAPTVVLALVALAFILAATFFDFGWDGQWYHQTAVYQMAHGWNPIRDPMHSFAARDVQPMLRHYAKEPWYVALALYQTTGSIEAAKAATWLALAVMSFSVLAAGLEFGLRPPAALVVAALASLNPVAVCEAASYLVDGLLVSFLTCFVAGLFCWFRRRNSLVFVIVPASAVLCINSKLTGLVYLCFACAAGGIYALAKQRQLVPTYAAIQFAAVLLGVALFGFNPYVTNTVHGGNPFYPLLGAPARADGLDPIDRYETPRNLIARGPAVRLGYALFSRPGAQPVFGGENAQLMWPFDVGWKDFNMFRIHGVRLSGFGPLFSGAFLIGVGLLACVLARPGAPRLVWVLFVGTIVLSLLISRHTWWARLGPQLWWLPIIAVLAGISLSSQRACHGAAWGLAALLLANATLVAFAHFRWEFEATRTLREQMAFLRTQGDVEVDFQYFREPFEERLRAAGVSFHAVRRLSCEHPMELQSVAPGYPFPVRACILSSNENSHPGTQPTNQPH